VVPKKLTSLTSLALKILFLRSGMVIHSVILELRRLRQDDCKFEASLVYIRTLLVLKESCRQQAFQWLSVWQKD
jgi:hypothetical protein